jgi:hypothetical protein
MAIIHAHDTAIVIDFIPTGIGFRRAEVDVHEDDCDEVCEDCGGPVIAYSILLDNEEAMDGVEITMSREAWVLLATAVMQHALDSDPEVVAKGSDVIARSVFMDRLSPEED